MKSITKITILSLIILLGGFSMLSADSGSFERNLYWGISHKDDVLRLQQFLFNQGVYFGPINGNFLNQTYKAVKDFQNRENIEPKSGFFGPITRKRANELMKNEEKVSSDSQSNVLENLQASLITAYNKVRKLEDYVRQWRDKSYKSARDSDVASKPINENTTTNKPEFIPTQISTTSQQTNKSEPKKESETPVFSSNEKKMIAYTTSYTYWDNTPPGSADISNSIIHNKAGGIGTYDDPITIAVGHSIINGKDVLDFPAGTKFYIPNIRKYFIVEDTCGDGRTPQNGPCHNLKTADKGAEVWLDMWIDGRDTTKSLSNRCAEDLTANHLVIQNPASNYAVVKGVVMNGGTCPKQYGDVLVTQ